MALRAAVLALSLLSLAACGTAPGPYTGSYWGADATATPGWGRLGEAALTAATDPFTWLPAAAAVGVQIGGADDDIADWANEETMVSGSRDTADDARDWLRAAGYASYGAAGLLAPAPAGDWLAPQAKGSAVGGAALLRSAARSVGKAWVSTCRSRWSPYPLK